MFADKLSKIQFVNMHKEYINEFLNTNAIIISQIYLGFHSGTYRIMLSFLSNYIFANEITLPQPTSTLTFWAFWLVTVHNIDWLEVFTINTPSKQWFIDISSIYVYIKQYLTTQSMQRDVELYKILGLEPFLTFRTTKIYILSCRIIHTK